MTLRETTARITRLDLLRREGLGMFICLVVLMVLSAVAPAPLAPPIRADTVLDADSSAPWFFLWVQQLLKLGNPFLLGVLLPLAVIFLIGSLPYLFTDVKNDELGRWFPRSGRIVQILFGLVAAAIVISTLIALLGAS